MYKEKIFRIIFLFLAILSLIFVYKYGHISFYSLLKDIIIAFIMALVIDYITIERPKQRKIKSALLQTVYIHDLLVSIIESISMIVSSSDILKYGSKPHKDMPEFKKKENQKNYIQFEALTDIIFQSEKSINFNNNLNLLQYFSIECNYVQDLIFKTNLLLKHFAEIRNSTIPWMNLCISWTIPNNEVSLCNHSIEYLKSLEKVYHIYKIKSISKMTPMPTISKGMFFTFSIIKFNDKYFYQSIRKYIEHLESSDKFIIEQKMIS